MLNANQGGAKVVVLGNSGAGKTSILNYAINDSRPREPPPTIGCNCQALEVDVGEERVTLRVWDTAGQELYRSIVPIYIRDATAALLVYDCTDLKSFQAIDHWHSVLMEEQTNEVLVYLVGNKVDLAESMTVVPDQGKAAADGLRAKFFTVSAVEGTRIRELFATIAGDIVSPERFQQAQRKQLAPQEEGGCC
jgi:small GTP-binding protein